MSLSLTPPSFPDLTLPRGFLSKEPACQACWYFYTLAEKNRLQVGDGPESQTLYDDELWMDKRYASIAKAVAMLYGLDSPEEWQPYWGTIKRQAISLGYGEPHPEYMRNVRDHIN